jgi:hypothetical protein
VCSCVGALADRIETGDRTAAVEVGLNPTDVIVGRRGERQQVYRWVEPERLAAGHDGRELLLECMVVEVTAVEP